jgi:hypothetical protein
MAGEDDRGAVAPPFQRADNVVGGGTWLDAGVERHARHGAAGRDELECVLLADRDQWDGPGQPVGVERAEGSLALVERAPWQRGDQCCEGACAGRLGSGHRRPEEVAATPVDQRDTPVEVGGLHLVARAPPDEHDLSGDALGRSGGRPAERRTLEHLAEGLDARSLEPPRVDRDRLQRDAGEPERGHLVGDPPAQLHLLRRPGEAETHGARAGGGEALDDRAQVSDVDRFIEDAARG